MHDFLSFLRRKLLIGLVFAGAFFSVKNVSAQRVSLKTNALEYLVLTPNFTLEARLSKKLSLQFGIATNPIQSAIADYKFTNFRIDPELRYWFNRPMARHFVALSTSAGGYSFQLKDRFLKFNAFAAGISYGYALVLHRHWNVEFEIGAGVAAVNGKDYRKDEKIPDKSNMKKLVPVPVRTAISFGYVFK